MPLATLIAAEEGLNLSIYHPSKHNTDSGTGCISGNFSKISGKRCILVDDVITSGNTLTELVAYLRRHNAVPVAILVIFDKRGVTEVDGVPVYSLFSIRLIDLGKIPIHIFYIEVQFHFYHTSTGDNRFYVKQIRTTCRYFTGQR